MSEKTLEWDLAFARDEVVDGLEKLFSQAGSTYTRTDTAGETHFHATFSPGALEAIVRPLSAHRSPFNIQVTLHRSLLVIKCRGLSAQEEDALRHRLTLTFLRVGG